MITRRKYHGLTGNKLELSVLDMYTSIKNRPWPKYKGDAVEIRGHIAHRHNVSFWTVNTILTLNCIND